MKLFPVHPVFWPSLLFVCVSRSEIEVNNPDVCQEKNQIGLLYCVAGEDLGEIDEEYDFRCVLSPTNILNCSWSFDSLESDKHVAVYISVCDDSRTVRPMSLISEERAGSTSLALQEYEKLNVVLQINVSTDYQASVYRNVYNPEAIAIPSPPENVSAIFRPGGLQVTWGVPKTRNKLHSRCFRYEVDMGEELTQLDSQQSHLLPNADPELSYRVRVRTVILDKCTGPNQWSDWSQTFTVQPSLHQLNVPVIISLSLGIPMILLALLLLVRHQRVFEILFPPIPHPPSKYKNFLEKTDMFPVYYPASPVTSEEEITEVEDAGQSQEKECEE